MTVSSCLIASLAASGIVGPLEYPPTLSSGSDAMAQLSVPPGLGCFKPKVGVEFMAGGADFDGDDDLFTWVFESECFFASRSVLSGAC